jgi:hypothetical protein
MVPGTNGPGRRASAWIRSRSLRSALERHAREQPNSASFLQEFVFVFQNGAANHINNHAVRKHDLIWKTKNGLVLLEDNSLHSATKESPIQSLIEAVHDVKAVL